MNDVMIACEALSKAFHDGATNVEVLKAVDFVVRPGDSVAIVGPSGSGKSTLLQLLGGLDTPSSGKVLIQGLDWSRQSERERCRLRNQHLGFVYQFHHLLPEFSALENVAMPLLIAGNSVAEASEQAQALLVQVGLGHRLQHRPAQLSGGERQRVAIARALVNRPGCVFADEPTGNLDQSTAAKVFELMLSLNAEIKTALVIVTHDAQLAQRMNQRFHLQDGALRPL